MEIYDDIWLLIFHIEESDLSFNSKKKIGFIYKMIKKLETKRKLHIFFCFF
jgi:hypothetical protein